MCYLVLRILKSAFKPFNFRSTSFFDKELSIWYIDTYVDLCTGVTNFCL